MATRRAVANGNWSSPSTWDGGTSIPGNGDTIYANGFNVTIDQNVNIGGANNPTVNAGSFVAGQYYEIVFVGTTNFTTIGASSNTVGTIFLATGVGSGTGTAKARATITTLANTAAGATGGGGNFAMSSAYNITTDILAGTTTCLTVTGATALTLDGLRVIGGTASGAVACSYAGTTTCTLSNGTFTGGASVSAFAINNASSGSVNVSASCTFTGGSNSGALNNASSGTINVNASCTFTGNGNSGNAIANTSAAGVVNINASCTFTGGNNSTQSEAIRNVSTGTINISSPCTFTGGTASSSAAIGNASTGTVIVTNGTFTASAFSNAVTSSSTSADVRLSGNFLDHWSGFTAVYSPKFRLGTTPTAARHQMALAGTTDSYINFYTADNSGFGLPAANNVRAGVSYGGGAATGTCAVPSASSVAFGVAVDNTTGTAVLTPANVQSALTAQGLTITRAGNLDNLNASISSRLASASYTAPTTPPTAASVASAVWGAETKTITGGTVDTLTNAPSSVTPSDIWGYATRTLTSGGGVTASEIRQEMDANSTKLSAIKAKTDALNVDRVNNTATLSQVGNLLAQANS